MNPVDMSKCRITLGFKVPYPNTPFFQKRGLAGKPHRGVDLAPYPEVASEPIFIVAPVSGTIVWRGFHTQFGNMCVIQSLEQGYEYIHMLCHMDKFANQIQYKGSVVKGNIVGLMGSTGTSTSKHLHYQVEVTTNQSWQSHPWIQGNWKFVDPKTYM